MKAKKKKDLHGLLKILMSAIVCGGPSPAPVAAKTLILDTTVSGFRPVMEKVVSLVV